MLYKVAPSGSAHTRIAEKFSYDVELVVTRKDLLQHLAPCSLILFFDDLGVVLDDVGQSFTGEAIAPQIVSLDARRVGRIARPIVVSLVEWKEPGILAAQLGAETHFLVVNREMHHAAPELKEKLAGIAVALVLLDSVLYRLLGQEIFQFKCGDRQTVDKNAQIEREFSLVLAVPELARDAEDIRAELLDGFRVFRRRRAIEEVHVLGTVLDTVAQNINDPALRYLSLQACEERYKLWAVFGDFELLRDFWLRCLKESQ